MYCKLFLCVSTVLVFFVLYVQSNGHGGQGPIIIKTSGKRGRNSDLIMIGGKHKCGHGPTIIKTSGKRRHGSDLILLGGQNHCHEKKKEEVKHVPVPYEVKKEVFIPVPYKETVHVPVHVPVHIPVYVKKQEHGHEMKGMDMDMGGYGDMGMHGMDMHGMGDMGDMGGYRRR